MTQRLSTAQLTILILALMTTAMGQSLVFAILAPLGREVQLNELQITSLIASSALVFGLSAPYWGHYSDHRGRKPVMIIGLIAYAIGTAAFTSVFYAGLLGLLGGWLLYATLLLTRCAQALIMSATGPAAAAYAADNSSRNERVRTMAKLGTANSMGTILGPAVSGALATLGLLAPLYFAAALAAIGIVIVWRGLPARPSPQLTSRQASAKLSVRDPRIFLYLMCGVAIYVGFSGIQQTLGFQLQDKMQLSGIETAQMTGAALMVCAVFTFLTQVTVLQRVQLPPMHFIRIGLMSMLIGAVVISIFETFTVLAIGMAFLGTGSGLCMPAISSGASLAVSVDEQGAAAGLVSACPAIGFVLGPVCAGGLYQYHPPLAPLFSTIVFLLILIALLGLWRKDARKG